ncbi:indole-3-glycerol phosphate synthase TrpC [Jeotgalibacillus soli]|uniref:Indole-3-glycerol phosphate synthase n=1 Tax=Jeotgalibacillus soli TaxID=889306 RepID=A0A0C2R5I4_9BACL|nr:indole-3-glycerol phosphate synthase TrpC [Jeotgalibacillus soli]KIL45495.1 indole-3-glycerol-phosphate synthase [Jeotgalibacillus soli]
MTAGKTILSKIIDEKHKEVEAIKQDPSLLLKREGTIHVPKNLYTLLQENHRLGIIAEIKRASPSKGMINAEVNPVEQAKLYQSHGASAISVLTDEPFFKGTMDDLTAVAEEVHVPVLCKDFIIDPIQILRAKKAGASIILLIVAALDQETLQSLFDYANELDLEVLVEVHDEEELKRALNIGAVIIGVNNRNLKTFEVDLATSERLAKKMPLDRVHFISESGFSTSADAAYAVKSGAKGILVGETLMKAADVGAALDQLRVPLASEKQ